MPFDVVLVRGHFHDFDEALSSLLQMTLFNLHNAEIVMTLNVIGVYLGDVSITPLGGLQVLDVICVDVTHQNQTLDVIRIVTVKRNKKRERIQRSLLLVEKEREVKERTPETGFNLDGLLKPYFSIGRISIIHGQHAEIKVNPIRMSVRRKFENPEEPLVGKWSLLGFSSGLH